MASTNTLTNKAREKFLKGALNWESAAIYCVLVDGERVKMDETLANMNNFLNTDNRTQPIRMTNMQATDGAASADNVTFPKVAKRATAYTDLIIYVQEGGGSDLTNAYPLAIIGQATGLPITANGGDITVTWDTGANKIFKL